MENLPRQDATVVTNLMVGVDFGPNLKGWGENRSVEEIATALINPSAGIAHGLIHMKLLWNQIGRKEKVFGG